MEIKIVNGKFFLLLDGIPREVALVASHDGTVQWTVQRGDNEETS